MPADETIYICKTCGGRLAGGQCPRCLLSLASLCDDEEPFQPRVFGDYELLEEIARGGMGVVYRARQISLNREVALKMILAGELAGKSSLRMFQREAHAAAALHHPHIVPVYEIGENDLQPYFTMRFVAGGKNIATWAKTERAPKAIAAAAEKVARAVAHAHERGVLHRDLKPSNILWDGGPQVTDFGLAKLTADPATTLTLGSDALGSPSYMAPEQAGGNLEEVTTATDVYGIGAVLYEMLSGRPPFRGKSALETLQLVKNEPPPPLPGVDRDLATICLRCLEKSPSRRYGSALEVADELARFQRGEPIEARPVSRAEHVWRWCLRNRKLAAAIAAFVVAMFVGIIGVTWQWRKTEHARVEQFKALERLQWNELDHWTDEGDTGRSLAYLASLLRAQPERWQAAMYAMSIVEQNRFPLLAGPSVSLPGKRAVPAQLAPNGTWFATAGEDRVVRIWDVASGDEMAQFPQAAPITALAVSERDWKFAVATADGRLSAFPEPSLLARENATPIVQLRFSADGTRLLARTATDVEVHTPTSHTSFSLPGGIKGAALSGDGTRVVAWNAREAAAWETGSRKELLRVQSRQGFGNGAIAAGGARVAFLDGKFHARIWDVDSAQPLPDIESPLPARYHLALNAAGTRIAIAGWGNDITVHDTDSAAKVSPVMRHNYHVDRLVASPDGLRTLSFGWDEMLQIWNAEDGRSVQGAVRLPSQRSGSTFDPSHDASRVLIHTPGEHGKADAVTVWSASTVKPALRHAVPGFRNFNSGSMSPDGRLGTMGTDGYGPTRCHVYEIATGKVLIDSPTNGEVYATLFSPDMQRCFAVTNTGALHGWSLQNGAPLWPPSQQSGGIIPAAISPDGTRLVAGHSDGHVRIYDTANGQLVHSLDGLGETRTIRFAPDGSGRFVTAGVAGIIHLCDVQTGKITRTFSGHIGTIVPTAWSPDSRAFASAAGDRTVRIWDVTTGQLIGAPMPHLAVVSHLEFSPDGTRLVTVTRDGTIRIWDPRTQQPVSPSLVQGQACTTVRFTADGAAFFVHDHNGFRFWDTASGLPVTLHYKEPVAGGFAIDDETAHSFITRDGTRAFLSYSKNDGAAWPIPQPRSRVPEWFPDFLELLAQLQRDKTGALRLIPHEPAAAFAKRITGSDAFAVWARERLGAANDE